MDSRQVPCLPEEFPRIIKEAFEVGPREFAETVEEATEMLSRENGDIGNLNIIGRMVKIRPHGEALVIGDMHGDLESLVEIMLKSNFQKRLAETSDAILIFLGDYGDRGLLSVELYYTVLKLKLLYPEKVVLMRGNHEGPADLLPSPHDLPNQLRARFGEKGIGVYARIRELFDQLYNAVLVEERCIMIHGGIPLEARTVNDLAYAHTLHPEQSFLEDMLWSDPDETTITVEPSPRGAGRRFGRQVTLDFLRRFKVDILVRGHESCREGFKIDHGGKILTLFSRKGPPYPNIWGAYLDVELEHRFETVEELIPNVHKF